jgi:hypothetical protein
MSADVGVKKDKKWLASFAIQNGSRKFPKNQKKRSNLINKTAGLFRRWRQLGSSVSSPFNPAFLCVFQEASPRSKPSSARKAHLMTHFNTWNP